MVRRSLRTSGSAEVMRHPLEEVRVTMGAKAFVNKAPLPGAAGEARKMRLHSAELVGLLRFNAPRDLSAKL
jgi:hypothetical protein